MWNLVIWANSRRRSGVYAAIGRLERPTRQVLDGYPGNESHVPVNFKLDFDSFRVDSIVLETIGHLLQKIFKLASLPPRLKFS